MTSLYLHPDAVVVEVDDLRLQLRSPDGMHVTFDRDRASLRRAFDLLRTGVSVEELRSAVDPDLVDELLDLLDRRKLVHRECDVQQFARLVEQHMSGGGRLLDAAPPTAVEVKGAGRIARLARQALGHLPAADGAQSLLLAVADVDDIEALSAANAAAVAARRPITFARWDQSRILIGPFVVPGQTACLECALHRQRAACLHPDELSSYRRARSAQRPFEGGLILDNFIAALIARHVVTILAGAYELAHPGAIAIHEPVTMNTTIARVMRLPRCPVCRPSTTAPRHAIRDLN